MIFKRIITGLVLAAAAAAMVLLTPLWLFAAACFFICLAAFYELFKMKPLHFVFAPAVALLISSALAVLHFAHTFAPLFFVSAGCAFWFWQSGRLIEYWRHTNPREKYFNRIITYAQMYVVLMAAFCAMLWLRMHNSPAVVVAVLTISCSTDIGGYAVGKLFGRRKLMPSVSPGKTIEGALGGVALAGIVAVVAGFQFLELSYAQLRWWFLAAVAAAVFSIIGDLYISRIKRQAGVKNSGNLLPGHGGLLDRVDGVLAGAPAFVVVWQWAG